VQRERLAAVLGAQRAKAAAREIGGQDDRDLVVVLGDQHQGRGRARAGLRSRLHPISMQGQPNANVRAAQSRFARSATLPMPQFFINRPVFAWVIALFIVLLGVIAIPQLPVERYPTVAPPTVSITAVYPGATPQTMDDAVVGLIERELSSVKNLLYFESSTDTTGTAQITATFQPGVDPDMAQVDVQNRIKAVEPRLPQTVRQNGLIVESTISNFLMFIALTSETGAFDETDLGDYMARNVVEELRRVEGVGKVQLFGAEKAMRIWVDPARLIAYNLSMTDVTAAIARQNAQIAPGRGGDAPAPLREGEAPLIVLLTPGPRTASYYEQAYLARHLGLPLVEGGDLTVRDGVVYLKTLAGLHRVHVIMRRVDDESCDPLELQSSLLGVAGLTQAAMRGNVLVANSLGSSLLESGALLGYLPALSKRLLGEPLRMPSVATWWCGEDAALETVIARLDRLVIKPSFSQLPQAAVFGQDLDGAARAGLLAPPRAHPHNYIAQELVRLSQAPVWKDGATPGLQARAIGLRVFACATPNGYVVMPGGLTRVATGPDARVLTMQMGGASKDTWVQARSRVEVHRLQQRSITGRDLVREDTNLSSRVAENLLWFGRHAERTDNICRLLRVALDFLFNVRFDQRGAEWPTVEALCIWFGLLDEGKKPATPGASRTGPIFTDAEIESALLTAVVSPAVPGLARQQQQLHRLAGQLHERFSVDNWRALNRMVQPAGAAGEQPSQSGVMTILDDAAAALMTLAGFAFDGMTRDLGWRFMSIGRRLERLQFQSVVLQRALAMNGSGNLEWLLELSDSIITYRARYRAQPEWLPVLDLLLLDETNPRSIVFQLNGILGTLGKIEQTHGPCGSHMLAPLKTELLALDPDTDLKHGNPLLGGLLDRIGRSSAALSEQISVQFFSYTDNGRQRNRSA